MLRKILWDVLPVRRVVTFSATSDEEGSATEALRASFLGVAIRIREVWVGRHRVVTRHDVLAGEFAPARAKADDVPLAENEIGQLRVYGFDFCVESSSPDWRRGG